MAPSTSQVARPVAAFAVTGGLLALACLASLAWGARDTGPGVVLEALTAPVAADADHAVVQARLPRTVAGLLVGAALGVAGAALQGVARNPLADAGILGINAGAALAVVAATSVLGVRQLTGFIWFAFLGAAAAAALAWAVASRGRGGATPVGLALAGAAVAAGCSSVTSAVLVTGQETLEGFRFWQVGSVAGRGWDLLLPVLPFLVVGGVLTLAAGRVLNALALGDDVARGLGQRVGRARAAVGLGVVVLCGAATAVAGPIAFVGLVVPHVARALAGPDYRVVLPLSALLGPVLVLAADVAGRLVLPPGEVPAGVLTALVGAPVLVWLVRRRGAVAL